MDLLKYTLRASYGIELYVLYILTTCLRMNSATITDNKYKVVTKTLIQNHAGSFLSSSTWKTKLGCATACDNSNCLSFSYNSATRECRTYTVEICHRDDGVTSSTVSFYAKVVSFTSLNHCGDVPIAHCSGVYTLSLTTSVQVFCDKDTAGGPWTVIANRYDGSVDFYQTWNQYKNGFGSLTGEFWLGFENLRAVLAQNMKLRIEMEGWDGSLKYVEYSTFSVSDEASKYVLSIGGYSTPDGLFNALSYHNGRPFSTHDNDNDAYSGSCASGAYGAWWYGECIDSNLFGRYTSETGYDSMLWKYFVSASTSYTPVRTMRMMLIKA
ncbi:fibrinogen-like protein A [Pecten maximus]|uniref:fibrinogen-like protein A n=1 Tax=Pecten maximus TaxID=6579 RepID=UPI0014580551|nr:fibrinogen-like protein A [Pecten maximus]